MYAMYLVNNLDKKSNLCIQNKFQKIMNSKTLVNNKLLYIFYAQMSK